MTQFAFRNFEGYATGPARIMHVVRQLQLSEVGRLFLNSLPHNVTFVFVQGDAASRASVRWLIAKIFIPRIAFRGPHETQQTVIHELARLLQRVAQFDAEIREFLEGAHNILLRHVADRRFAWVTEPLDRIRTEETMAQDLVGLIFRLGYGRDFHDRYYVPGDERPPPPGTLRPTLTAPERATFLAAMRRLQAIQLSPEQLRANWMAFEEFHAVQCKPAGLATTRGIAQN